MSAKSFFIAICLCLINTTAIWASEAEDYQRDAGAYRDAYSVYTIKKGAYTQFKTFATEEELITSARSMLLARADVWSSYWQLLWINMAGLNEFPIEEKKVWRQKFITEVDWLKGHKEAILKAKTRAELHAVAMELNNKSEAFGTMAFAANADIVTGSLIQSAQQLLNFNQGLMGRVAAQQFTTEEKEIKTRGLEVQAERVSKSLTQLKEVKIEFGNDAIRASRQSFLTISRDTSPLFTELNQQHLIAKELAEGVEW